MRAPRLLAAALVFTASTAIAGPLESAKSSLDSARDSLKAAPKDYEGYRRAALDHIDEALGKVDLKLDRQKQQLENRK